MSKQGRSQLTLGVILILAGVWFFLDKTNPQIHALFAKYMEWPLNMFLIGAGILLLGLIIGAPGLAVPACIVAGVGAVSYLQELTKNPNDWYVWTALLGFVGLGNLIQGLLSGSSGAIRDGMRTIAVGGVIYLGFAAFFGDVKFLGAYGPALLLILLGVWLLGSGVYRMTRKSGE